MGLTAFNRMRRELVKANANAEKTMHEVSTEKAETTVETSETESTVVKDVEKVEKEENVSLSDLTNNNLKKLANELGVDISTATNKAELVKAFSGITVSKDLLAKYLA